MRPLSECRVLVTPTSFARHDSSMREQLENAVGEVIYNEHGRPLTTDELLELIPEVDGYIAGLDPITGEVLNAANRLQVIARYGVGLDNVDLEAAAANDIIVCNTPGANAESVAELTIALMLALSRNLPRAVNATKAGEWPRLDGTTLAGKVVGLVGLGAIGSAVAQRLTGFGCRVLAYDPYVDEAVALQSGVQLQSLPTLRTRSDFISLHCPLTPETEGLVDADFLEQMKPGSYLINTARGQLLNEEAVAAAVDRGHLAGVALDAFRQQPPSRTHPLLELESVIATPHMGAHTDGAVNAMGSMAVADCLAVLRGESPAHPVKGVGQ